MTIERPVFPPLSRRMALAGLAVLPAVVEVGIPTSAPAGAASPDAVSDVAAAIAAQQAVPPPPAGGLITNFTNAPKSRLDIDGIQYGIHAASNSYNITLEDTHTLRFELHQGDRAWYDGASTDRDQITCANGYTPGTAQDVSFSFMFDPGPASSARSWFLFMQLHNDDNSAGVGTSPPIALQLGGTAGWTPGDHLQVRLIHCPKNLNPSNRAGNLTNLWPYISPSPIVRGQWYDCRIQTNTMDDTTGYLRIWINGLQIVNYAGPVGYGWNTDWEIGLYRNTSPETQVVHLRNLTFSPLPNITGS
jgi:Polysaccharide lyase